MVASSSAQLALFKRSNRLRDGLMAAAALLAAATAALFAQGYAAEQSTQEIGFWANRIERSTQAGARVLGRAVDSQVAALAELADNASLRVYLWRLTQPGAPRDESAPEAGYLNGLLSARTDTGTRARAPAFSQLLLVSPALQPVSGALERVLTASERLLAQQALATRTRQLWLIAGEGGASQMLQAMPVQPPPGAAGGKTLAGVLLATNDATDFLQPLLANLPGYFDTDTSLLIGAGEPRAVVLAGAPPYSDLEAPVEPGFRQVQLGGGVTVLQSTQRVPGTDWTFIKRIDADLALGAMRQRIWARNLALALAALALAATLLAWRERSARLAASSHGLPALLRQRGFSAGNTAENRLLNKLVASLIDVIDLHDPYSAFHSARLAELCRAVAGEMGLEQQSTSHLVTAALLANIGKLSLPRELLTKRAELSPQEQVLLQSHVEEGVEILRKLEIDDPVLSAIAQKQESLDGTGYPHGIRADHITLPGRILALSNAYVALVSPRAYRDALNSSEALAELRKNVGSAYDGEVFAALERAVASGAGMTDWEFQPGAAG